MRQSLVAAFLGLAMVLGVATAGQGQTSGVAFAPLRMPPIRTERARHISVTGVAQLSATPNEMIALFGVSTIAPSVDESTLAQARKTDKLVRALKKASGAEAKITTGSFTITPYAMPAVAVARTTPNSQEWVFSATVTAYADSLPAIGRAIDAATAAGATRVGSTGFRAEPMGAAVFNRNYAGGPESGRAEAPERKPFASMEIRVGAKSASECTSRGSEMTDRVKRAIKHALDGKGTVQVVTFHVSRMPQSTQYGYRQRGPQSPPRQGFRAHNTVQVRTRDLKLLGAIVTAGMGAGADRLEWVQFTLSDDSPVTREAIERAAQDARTKAATVAKAMGVKLGKVLGIWSHANVQPQFVYGNRGKPFALTETPGSTIAARSGQVAVSAVVNADYAIK